ncbi:MAG: TIGR03013 family XrtA/PEP-CTERM system glycosyltransferase [Kiloniellaceae bacterium]
MTNLFRMHFAKPFLVLAGIEAIVLIASLYLGVLASWVDFELTYNDFIRYLPQAAAYSFIFVTIMFALGTYNDLAEMDFYHIIIRTIISFILGFAVLSAIFYLFPEFMIWRSVMASAMTSAFFGILLTRFVFLRAIDLTPLKRRVAVIGTGPQAARIEALERSGQAHGFACAGYIDASGDERRVPASRILPTNAPLLEFVERENIDEIIVAVQDRRRGLPMEALVDCGFRGITVSDYPAFWEREARRVDLDALPRNWMLFSSSFPGGRTHRLLKRAFDIAMSLTALVFLFPLIVSTALAIKIDSPGPVFYRQQRVGAGGGPFQLLKFRSMRADAERDGMPRWSAAKDARVTAVGGFIRKVRIDEIPQIVNVLKGEMSFVGPRPERPYFVEQLANQIPYYMERFRVKPGITGWAQLNYPYGASVEDAKAKLEYDLYYIKHYGLMLDVIIVLQTIKVILWPLKPA